MDIREIVAGIGSSTALQEAAAKVGISPDQAQTALQGVLQHVSAGQPMEGMVQEIAAKVGIDPAQVQRFLPSIMGLLQGHADNASVGVQATLAGLQGSPIGDLLSGLDANKDGSVVDDALGMVKGLFGGKPG